MASNPYIHYLSQGYDRAGSSPTRGGELKAIKKPRTFSLIWWMDFLFALFVIAFITIKIQFHGYLRILLEWLFFIFVYSYGVLKTMLFRDFKSTILSDFKSSKVTWNARIYCGLLSLLLLISSFFSLRYILKYWDRGFDPLWFQFLNDFLLWFIISLPFGFMAFTGEKIQFFRWVNPKWGKGIRVFLGLKTI
jgi:hypothetical protein